MIAVQHIYNANQHPLAIAQDEGPDHRVGIPYGSAYTEWLQRWRERIGELPVNEFHHKRIRRRLSYEHWLRLKIHRLESLLLEHQLELEENGYYIHDYILHSIEEEPEPASLFDPR